MSAVHPLARAGEGRSREQLLAAAAQASRLLLEATDVMSSMPEVLELIGQAAGVDRTTLAVADEGADGQRWLVIRSQWNAPGIAAAEGCRPEYEGSPRRVDCFCNELKAGRSVTVCGSDERRPPDNSIVSGAAKSSVIVPFLVDGEYAGAVGFDTFHAERQFDTAVINALEIAAGVIGTALQRERLIDAVRREREAAAEQRVTELARANAALRANLARLASQPAQFFDHVLLETCRHAGAEVATAVVIGYESGEWLVGSHVCDGATAQAPFAGRLPPQDSDFIRRIAALREPQRLDLGDASALPEWPELVAFHRERGHRSLYLLPLVFGENTIGVVALGFGSEEPLPSELVELLVALGQQVTLAMAMKRLFYAARQSAVLAERNRIGREIHDGLAQAFTGILMQLGAAEELAVGSPITPVMNRIRDIAKEGLAEARRSVLALRPDEQPRPGGLELALRQLAERSTVVGRVASSFAGGNTVTGLPPEHEHALLRIAQEAVINAVRHAQPRNIEIRLEQEGADVVLSVSDDGCGLAGAPALYAQQGFGLANMRQRAEDIGGRWQLHSAPGQGTKVSVRVPRGAAGPCMVPVEPGCSR